MVFVYLFTITCFLPFIIFLSNISRATLKQTLGGGGFPDGFICALDDNRFWSIFVLLLLAPVDWKHMVALHNMDKEGKHREIWLHIITRNCRSVDSLCSYRFEFWPLAFPAEPELFCTCLKTNGVLSFSKGISNFKQFNRTKEQRLPMHTAVQFG